MQRSESRARHFFKDILPEEAFERTENTEPVAEPKTESQIEFEKLMKNVMDHCELVAAGQSDTDELVNDYLS